jgi:hypothetical protein
MTHSASLTRSRARQRKLGVAVLLAALMSVTSAVAQQAPLQSYDVELLIFRNLSAQATPEDWGSEAATAGQQMTLPEDEPSEPPAAPAIAAPTASFPSLPAAKMKLTAIEDTMRRGRGYQPVAHIGWTQPGFARNAAQYLSLDSLVPGSSGLRGQVALSRGRYLHLTLDLAIDSDGQRYVLRQTRRMRSNERHYIDSPKLGVIAIITPSAGQDAG